MAETTFPDQGLIFWPVGNGDSTTIVVDDAHVIQVDLHHQVAVDEDGATCAPVVDRLIDSLPKRGGKPYLAVFALTHADADHCQGFGALLDSEPVIGELWATPRLWREYTEAKDAKLCEDAQRFHEEAKRRVKATLEHIAAGREVPSGDRVRIIGYDPELDGEDDLSYAELPEEQRTIPGGIITVLDGEDVADVFEAFIHAPFKDDCANPRNDTSLAMQVTLKHDGGTEAHMLLLGDLAYATIKRIFDRSGDEGNDDRVAWDVLLAPHHCSKRVMYAPNDETGEEELKQDVLGALDASSGERAYIVASSNPIPKSSPDDSNPPHVKAKNRYQERAIEAFLCTQEHGSVEAPEPIVFILTPELGLALQATEVVTQETHGKTFARIAAAAALGGSLLASYQAVKRARGAEAAPTKPVGFGRA